MTSLPRNSRILGNATPLREQFVCFAGVGFLSVVVLLVLNGRATACLVCYRPPYQSLLERVQLSEQVVLVRAIDEKASSWRGQIVRVIKGKRVAVGQIIEINKAKSDSVTLGALQLMRQPVFTTSWTLEGSVDKELAGFLAGAVAVSSRLTAKSSARNQAQALRYFLPYLEHKNRQIADSAYTKIAAAPYGILRLFGADIKPEKLLTWIDDRHVPRKRKSLYITLLGVCGGKSEAAILEKWIDEGWDRQDSDTLGALLTALAEIKGEESIRFIEESYIQNRDRQLGELIAAVTALRVHGQDDGKVSRSRIQASFHLLLRERAPLAELIIDDFARWQDWSIAPKLMTIYAGEQQPWNNAMIIKYLKACPLPSAKRFLAGVAATRQLKR